MRELARMVLTLGGTGGHTLGHQEAETIGRFNNWWDIPKAEFAGIE